MDFREILTITGKPGLYRLVSNNRNTFIVESLSDGKRFPAFARDKVSPLEEISVFTEEEDMPLREVFNRLFQHKEKAKVEADVYTNNDNLKQLFEAFLPTYDHDRLYVSHMKKIVTWYNELVEHDVIFEENNSEENEGNDASAVVKNVKNENKPNFSDLKKTNVDANMPKNASSKAQAKTITTKPKAK